MFALYRHVARLTGEGGQHLKMVFFRCPELEVNLEIIDKIYTRKEKILKRSMAKKHLDYDRAEGGA